MIWKLYVDFLLHPASLQIHQFFIQMEKQIKNRARSSSFNMIPWPICSKLQQTSLLSMFYFTFTFITLQQKMQSKASGFEGQGWAVKFHSLLFVTTTFCPFLWKCIPNCCSLQPSTEYSNHLDLWIRCKHSWQKLSTSTHRKQQNLFSTKII